MLLELSEILACPSCGPPQALVAVVFASEGRRVLDGFLGCPGCDSRFPITSAVVRFEPEDGAVQRPVSPGTLPDETPLLIAALLDLSRGRGHVLLGHGLAEAAVELAGLAPGWEVICLETAEAPTAGPVAVSRLVVGARPLPLQPGMLGAMALAGEPALELLPEAQRLLVRGGRLVVLAPPEGTAVEASRIGLDVVAADDRALLAVRPSASRP